MATTHFQATGRPLRFLGDAKVEAQFPTAPAGTANTLVFDEAANAALAADMALNLDAYSYDGTTLKKAGVTVPVVADAPETTIRKAAAALATALITGNTASVTQAQRDRALGWLIRDKLGRG